MTRSQSREQAFALLFEKSFNPETDMDDIISLSLENELIEPDEFASMLAQTAWDKLFSIDDIIEKYSKNWKKHRISRVALSAMRLSICELMYIPEVPVGTSINEAVELCKKYARLCVARRKACRQKRLRRPGRGISHGCLSWHRYKQLYYIRRSL